MYDLLIQKYISSLKVRLHEAISIAHRLQFFFSPSLRGLVAAIFYLDDAINFKQFCSAIANQNANMCLFIFFEARSVLTTKLNVILTSNQMRNCCNLVAKVETVATPTRCVSCDIYRRNFPFTRCNKLQRRISHAMCDGYRLV
jgi:hypothetical protein